MSVLTHWGLTASLCWRDSSHPCLSAERTNAESREGHTACKGEAGVQTRAASIFLSLIQYKRPRLDGTAREWPPQTQNEPGGRGKLPEQCVLRSPPLLPLKPVPALFTLMWRPFQNEDKTVDGLAFLGPSEGDRNSLADSISFFCTKQVFV